MHPFQQHIKHYTATLITHPMSINEGTHRPPSNPQAASRPKEAKPNTMFLIRQNMLERDSKVIKFLKRKPAYTSAIAVHLEILTESALPILQAMFAAKKIGRTKGDKNRWMWCAL